MRGRRFVSEMVPVVAAQASADAAGPLDLAANRGPSLASRAHAEAANGRWRAETIVAPTPSDAPHHPAAVAAGRELGLGELVPQRFDLNCGVVLAGATEHVDHAAILGL